MRRAIQTFVILIIALIASKHSFADGRQTPIDPLTPSAHIAGGYDLSVGLSYSPRGEEGLSIDEAGISPFVRLEQQLSLPIRLRYRLTSDSSVAVTINPIAMHTRTSRSETGGTMTSSTWNSSVSKTVSLSHRLVPTHALDPALTLSFSTPDTLDLRVAGTLIRDPVVLSASITHAIKLDTKQHHISLGLGTGFFVNDKISFKTLTHHVIPTGDVALPRWSFALGIMYSFHTQGESDLYLGIQRVEYGGEGTVGLALEWYKHFGT